MQMCDDTAARGNQTPTLKLPNEWIQTAGIGYWPRVRVYGKMRVLSLTTRTQLFADLLARWWGMPPMLVYAAEGRPDRYIGGEAIGINDHACMYALCRMAHNWRTTGDLIDFDFQSAINMVNAVPPRMHIPQGTHDEFVPRLPECAAMLDFTTWAEEGVRGPLSLEQRTRLLARSMHLATLLPPLGIAAGQQSMVETTTNVPLGSDDLSIAHSLWRMSQNWQNTNKLDDPAWHEVLAFIEGLPREFA